MKRFFLFTLIGCVMAVAVRAVLPYESTFKRFTITTAASGGSSRATDTIWLNAVNPDVQDGSKYTGFCTYMKIGVIEAADTTGSTTHGLGMVDTVYIALKKRIGSRVALIDSTALKGVRLRTAQQTYSYAYPINTALDSTYFDDFFVVLTIADTTADTAGIAIHLPVTSETHFKE